MAGENFCLKWNDHHSVFFSNIESLCEKSFLNCLHTFAELRNHEINSQNTLTTFEHLLTQLLQKVLWTLSNLYAEKQVSSQVLTQEKVNQLLQLVMVARL